MTERTFESRPATKRDLAEFREEVIPKIDSIEKKMATKDDLKQFATKDDLKNLATKKDIEGIRELLKGPEGVIERLAQVEKRVGLSV